MNKKFIITSIILIWLSLSFLDELVDDWGQIESAPDRLGTFFDEELWPPDWSVLEAEEWADGSLHKPDGELCTESYEIFCSKAWIGMEITIKMAFVSTLVGFIISVPIASLSANNL